MKLSENWVVGPTARKHLGWALAVIGVVGASLAAPAGAVLPAGAQARTCNGQAATIVGTPDTRMLRGTNGPDVIVSHGAKSVRARGGDDVVCITGVTEDVSAGGGNDVVDTTRAGRASFTQLDDGEDRFIGGRRADDVRGGPGADQVDTGAGADSFSYDDGDTAELGAGNDTAHAFDTLPAGAVDGGPGLNTLVMSDCCEDGATPQWVVDNAMEQATVDGVTTFSWHNFRGFAFGVESGSLEFVGTDAGERLRISHDFEFGMDLARADMGGGNDEIVLDGACCTGRINAGDGTDWLRLVGYADERALTLEGQVVVDLEDGLVRGSLGRFPVARMENVQVNDFITTVLRGNNKANAFVVGTGCLVRVQGAGGPDTLRTGVKNECPWWSDAPEAVRADGGRGNDLRQGRNSNDWLVGGAGWDAVDGRRGRDTCAAEISARCERKP